MYPSIKPYETGFLDVGDGHALYYELSGNPDGAPAVYLHGGPGAGSHTDMRRFFDPVHYRVILFDQRGSGQSKPFASLENNSIEHLVADIEKLRNHLGIQKWLVAGGSWGSALALFYAQEYSESITALVLSGIFYGDQGVDWLTEEGGAAAIMPEWFASYRDLIPLEKRQSGLAEAYCEIMCGGSEEEIIEAVKCFTVWDTALLYFKVNHDLIREVEEDPEKFIPLCKIFFHFVHHYYKGTANRTKILEGVRGLGHIPCHIIHGRYDLICPVKNAFELHDAFPNSEIHVLADTGHTAREPNIAEKIVELTDRMAGTGNE